LGGLRTLLRLLGLVFGKPEMACTGWSVGSTGHPSKELCEFGLDEGSWFSTGLWMMEQTLNALIRGPYTRIASALRR
jgi:hypothetical protein